MGKARPLTRESVLDLPIGGYVRDGVPQALSCVNLCGLQRNKMLIAYRFDLHIMYFVYKCCQPLRIHSNHVTQTVIPAYTSSPIFGA
jgi:hypothetical protein